MRLLFRPATAIVLMGLPVLLVLILFSRQGGQSHPVALRDVRWPAALSGLPAQATDMAVDDDGVLWFPVLVPPNDQGRQVNLLYRYDPIRDAVQTFPLPDDEGSTYVARVEAGLGARKGKILVAWQSTLLEVDSATSQVSRLNVPLDPAKIVSGPEPATTRIYDIAVGKEGTVWVSRDHYPYLIAVYADGSSKEFALPKEAGSPERLAVDSRGRIWSTLIRHQPVSVGSDASAVNAYRFTLRFDPVTANFEVLPIAAYNISGRGGMVVAMAGDQPAAVQRVDTTDSKPIALTDYGLTMPGDEMAVAATGSIWYGSRSVAGLVDLDSRSRLTAFPLPTAVASSSAEESGSAPCVPTPIGRREAACHPSDSAVTTVQTPVLALAAAPDGSAWFSAGDRIGHAVP